MASPGEIFNYLGLDPYDDGMPTLAQMRRLINSIRLLLHPDKRGASAEAAEAQGRLGLDFLTLGRIEERLKLGGDDDGFRRVLCKESQQIRAAGGVRLWTSTWNPHRVEGGAVCEPLPSWMWRRRRAQDASSKSLSSGRPLPRWLQQKKRESNSATPSARHSRLRFDKLPPPPVGTPRFDGSDCVPPLGDGESLRELVGLAEAVNNNNDKTTAACVAIAFLDYGSTKVCIAVAELLPDKNHVLGVRIRDGSSCRLVATISLDQLLRLDGVDLKGVFGRVGRRRLGPYASRLLTLMDAGEAGW